MTQATAVIAVTGYSVVYDALPHTATGTATGVLGEDLSAGLDLTATTHTAVGASTDPWTFSDPAGNYAPASGTVDTEITPAPLTMTADDRSKVYGQTVVFAGTEFSTSGLLGTDDVTSVTLTSPGAAPTATVAGSPYAITPSAAVGTGLGNYAITYVDGELTVDLASLTITADDISKLPGLTYTFAGTEFSTVGLQNADTVNSATLVSAGAPALAPPGTYPIFISTAIGTGLANYTITYVQGTFTVGNVTPDVGDAAITTTATAAVDGAVSIVDPDPGQTLTLTITVAPTHGTATVAADGTFTYTPTGMYTGDDTFTIQGCDDFAPPACDTGTVTISVYPVAVPDAGVTSEGKTVEVDVEANDIGDAGLPQIVSGPAHGTATVGSIIYTPECRLQRDGPRRLPDLQPQRPGPVRRRDPDDHGRRGPARHRRRPVHRVAARSDPIDDDLAGDHVRPDRCRRRRHLRHHPAASAGLTSRPRECREPAPERHAVSSPPLHWRVAKR